MRDIHKRQAIFAAGVAATVALLLLLAQSGWSWEASTPATSRGHCFNELERAGPIAQPANTWSNLGFVIVGLAHLSGITGVRRGPAPLLAPLARVYYGFLVACLGWTSMFFHASISLAGEFVDMYSMVLFTSFVVAVNLGRTTSLGRARIGALYLAANALFFGAMLVHVHASLYIFIGLTFGILASDAYARRRLALRFESGWLAGAVACCLASFGIWILDRAHLLGSPTSWFQGHAVWHIGQSLTTALLFQHYAREQSETAPVLAEPVLAGAVAC
jgi:hypothetical protein